MDFCPLKYGCGTNIYALIIFCHLLASLSLLKIMLGRPSGNWRLCGPTSAYWKLCWGLLQLIEDYARTSFRKLKIIWPTSAYWRLCLNLLQLIEDYARTSFRKLKIMWAYLSLSKIMLGPPSAYWILCWAYLSLLKIMLGPPSADWRLC